MKLWIGLVAVLVPIQCLIAQEALDRIIAVVGDNIILQSELNQYSYSLAIQLGIDPRKEPEKLEKVRGETLNNLVVQKILLEKAKEDSVVVSDKQVESVLEEQINQMISQAGSREKVEEYFGMTVRQIRREFRKDVRERLLVDTIKNNKFRETQISRREIEEFYSSNKDSLPELKESANLSHILISVQPSESAAETARKKAERLLDRLKKGDDFEELAKAHSEDPGSASRGGNLGMMQRGDLVKEFEEVAFALNPGEISEIVRTEFGFHIIQLVRRAGEKINPRHILIRLDTTPDDERVAAERLEELKAQILAGETTFENAAKQFSNDETTAPRGGDLGWFQVDQFQIESFAGAIEGLNKGDMSSPVKTKFGFHLIRVNDRQPARKLDIKADWEQIEAWALNIKRQREFEKWVEESKKDIYLEIKA